MTDTGYRLLKGLRIERYKYHLSSIRMEDAEEIRLWRNAQIDCLRQRNSLTSEAQDAYFRNVIQPEFESPSPNQILVRFCKNTIMIGYGGIVHLDWNDKRGEVSFLLNNDRAMDIELYRKEFKIFLSMIKELAFDRLGLNKLTTEAYAHRPTHVSAIEESGFEREGVLGQHVLVNGKWVDAVLAACFREKYASKKD